MEKKHKHTEINMKQKRDICFHEDETLKATHIASHFNKLSNTDFSQFIVYCWG